MSGSFSGPAGTNSELNWQIQISEEASATETPSRNLVQAALSNGSTPCSWGFGAELWMAAIKAGISALL